MKLNKKNVWEDERKERGREEVGRRKEEREGKRGEEESKLTFNS